MSTATSIKSIPSGDIRGGLRGHLFKTDLFCGLYKKDHKLARHIYYGNRGELKQSYNNTFANYEAKW